MLAASGFCQYGLQFSVPVALVFTDFAVPSYYGETLTRTFLIVNCCLAGPLLCAFVALFGFHSYLRCLGVGTFDWILEQEKRADERARRNAPNYSTAGSEASSKAELGEADSIKQLVHEGGLFSAH